MEPVNLEVREIQLLGISLVLTTAVVTGNKQEFQAAWRTILALYPTPELATTALRGLLNKMGVTPSLTQSKDDAMSVEPSNDSGMT
jgi:uncharacterized protein YneF (UPF0154 family)